MRYLLAVEMVNVVWFSLNWMLLTDRPWTDGHDLVEAVWREVYVTLKFGTESEGVCR